jgi:hypothetical protein
MALSCDAIKLMGRVGTFVAAATIFVGVPTEVRAQGQEPTQLVNDGFSAQNGLFGTNANRRSPLEDLFRLDADSPLTRNSHSSDWLTADVRQYEVEPGPLHSALRADLRGVQSQEPPKPAHTGVKALVFETASDFNAYPRRQSTWVILGIGGAAAALAHPADDEVNGKLAGSDAAGKFFAAGKYIGSWYTQAGVATGLYVVGRYVLPHADGAPKTNKVSHIGFDMMRALIVSQTLTQGIKIAVRRDRPTGECCAFPSGHASATFATAAVIERHSDTGDPGRCSSSQATSRRRGCTTIVIS